VSFDAIYFEKKKGAIAIPGSAIGIAGSQRKGMTETNVKIRRKKEMNKINR